MKRWPSFPATVLVAFVFPAVLGAPAAAEKTRRLPIVDRAIAYHGGDLYRASETRLTIRSRSGAFRMTVRTDGEKFEHVVVDAVPDGRERKTRVTNDTAERWEGTERVTLGADGERRARDFVQSRVYFPFLPFRLNDASVWKEDLGLEEWDGRKLQKVKVTFDAGTSTDASDEYLYWFEPATGRLVQYAYSFGTGKAEGGLRLRKNFNERRVGGILFADSENLGHDGPGNLRVTVITPAYVKSKMQKISTVTLEDIQVKPLQAAAGAGK
jgi:hypothetical protein